MSPVGRLPLQERVALAGWRTCGLQAGVLGQVGRPGVGPAGRGPGRDHGRPAAERSAELLEGKTVEGASWPVMSRPREFDAHRPRDADRGQPGKKRTRLRATGDAMPGWAG